MTTTQTQASICCRYCGNDQVVILRPQPGVSESQLKGIAIECHECQRGSTYTWEQIAKQHYKKSA